jgi:hypothetical protein
LFIGTGHVFSVFGCHVRAEPFGGIMSFRVMQYWPRRAVLAGALAMPLASGLIPEKAVAQYTYDDILPKRTEAILRINPTVSNTTEVAIGARAAIGRAELGMERTGVAATGATLGKVGGAIAAEQTRAAADLATRVPAQGRARAAAVQAGTAEPPVAGLDHTAVIDSHEADPQ